MRLGFISGRHRGTALVSELENRGPYVIHIGLRLVLNPVAEQVNSYTRGVADEDLARARPCRGPGRPTAR